MCLVLECTTYVEIILDYSSQHCETFSSRCRTCQQNMAMIHQSEWQGTIVIVKSHQSQHSRLNKQSMKGELIAVLANRKCVGSSQQDHTSLDLDTEVVFGGASSSLGRPFSMHSCCAHNIYATGLVVIESRA